MYRQNTEEKNEREYIRPLLVNPASCFAIA